MDVESIEAEVLIDIYEHAVRKLVLLATPAPAHPPFCVDASSQASTNSMLNPLKYLCPSSALRTRTLKGLICDVSPLYTRVFDAAAAGMATDRDRMAIKTTMPMAGCLRMEPPPGLADDLILHLAIPDRKRRPYGQAVLVGMLREASRGH
jgi:hypothetical protein